MSELQTNTRRDRAFDERVGRLAERLLDDHSDTLRSAIEVALSESCPEGAIDQRDLAWSAAWLATRAHEWDPETKPDFDRLLVDELLGTHGPDAPRIGAWLSGMLGKPRSSGTLRLSTDRQPDRRVVSRAVELAWSVACEHRTHGWRPPNDDHPDAASPPRTEVGSDAYQHLYEMHHAHVEKAVSKYDPGGDLSLADQAWSGMFQSYWSEPARVRWSARSAITSTVIRIAKIMHINHKDALTHEPALSQLGMDDTSRTIVPSSNNAPVRSSEEDVEAYEHTLSQSGLTDKQCTIVRLIVEHGMSQKQVAQALGVSPAAITQMLDRAAKALSDPDEGQPSTPARGRRSSS